MGNQQIIKMTSLFQNILSNHTFNLIKARLNVDPEVVMLNH